MNEIDFVIAVRDRDNERIQRCINSIMNPEIQPLPIGDIIVVDYGSKEKVKVDSACIIYYDKNPIWNKSHALNLGIKKCKSEYICTVDCDIIFRSEMKRRLVKSLSKNSFIINTNVLRINVRDLKEDFEENIKKSRPWHNNNKSNVYSRANGGIQCFPRKWIEYVGGYDEELGVYFGSMDNRVYEQAMMCGLTVVNLNFPMFHQEHKNQKEENLPEDEQELAEIIRVFKANSLGELMKTGTVVKLDRWGGEEPNQEKFLKMGRDYIEMLNKTDPEKINFIKDLYQKIKQSKNKCGEVTIDDEKFKVTLE
jgi:glycosyltransferase involved in cell wall biosynthesis